MTTRRRRRMTGLLAPRRVTRYRADDTDYGVNQLDNTREDVHPHYHRDAAPDDRWLSPFRSEAIRALLILINAAQGHELEPHKEPWRVGQRKDPDELDIRGLAEDAGCTDKQLEVFMLTCAGKRQCDIARELGITHAGVHHRLEIARRKLVRVIPPVEVLREIARV